MDTSIQKRKCSCCKLEKPLASFCKSARGLHGVHSRCRECQSLHRMNGLSKKRELVESGEIRYPLLKACRKCGELKESFEFRASLDSSDGLLHDCRNCENRHTYTRRKERMAADPNVKNRVNATARRHVLKKKFGLTREQYELMALNCGDACEICGKPETRKRTKELAVDHCHKTGLIRGLLCSRCNLAIGMLDDDLSLIGNAIAYLSRFQERMNAMSAKPGFLEGLAEKAGEVLAAGAKGIDSVVTDVAAGIGKLLSAPERALAERVGEDIVDGMKADDVATSATVATPVAPATPTQ
jgi:Recombination endonuclease VII